MEVLLPILFPNSGKISSKVTEIRMGYVEEMCIQSVVYPNLANGLKRRAPRDTKNSKMRETSTSLED